MRENAPEDLSKEVSWAAEVRRGDRQALASGFASCYCPGMLLRRIRQTSALLATFVLAASLVMHGFGGPVMVVKSAMTAAGDMPMPMSSDMPMSGKCNGCDERGMAPAACTAFCGAMLALLSVPAVLDHVSVDTLGPAVEPSVTGHADPPDPYPPRLTILS